ncbi:MAG: hypothetical protein SNJ73_08750, partial [Acetobacteraceae bacterium]
MSQPHRTAAALFDPRRRLLGAAGVGAIGAVAADALAQQRPPQRPAPQAAPPRQALAPRPQPQGSPATTPLGPLDTLARHALIVDFDTGAVLLEKDADVPMPPASMSKLMTAYVVFEL